MRKSIGMALVMLVGTSMVGPGVILAQDEASDAPPSFSVVAPGESPLGVTYPEWVIRWNEWFLGIPADGHPMLTDDCQAGQEGDVFIIPSTYYGNTLETRCAVRADQHILVSPASVSCAREPGDTDEALLACPEDTRPTIVSLSATVDGEAIPMIDDYWVVTPIAPVELPEGNLFGAPAGVVDLIGGGWYAMIEPLAPGPHTIVIHSETDYPDDGEGLLVAETIATVEVAAPDDVVAGEEPSPEATE